MDNKCYVIVCRCDGKNLKAYENLDYYWMLRKQVNKHKKLFKK